MKDREYMRMREMEDTHWWYAALHRSVAAELQAQFQGRELVRILDAGCGTGGMIEVLRNTNPAWQVAGLDISPTALSLTRQRGFDDLKEGSVDHLPYDNRMFDAVVSLDVLYFEGVDDTKALAEFRRVLKPDGLLVLNLPAFPAFRGAHDEAVSGARRYRPGQVRHMLVAAGFSEQRRHCWNLWLSLPVLCWRHLSRWLRKSRTGGATSDLFSLPAPLNAIMEMICRVDMAFCRLVRMPFGISVLVVARRQVMRQLLLP